VYKRTNCRSVSLTTLRDVPCCILLPVMLVMVAHCSCRYTLANKCTLIQVIRKVFCKFNYNITCFWFCLYFYGYSYYMQCLVYYFLGTQQCIRVCVHESMWCLNGRLYPCVRIRRSPVGRRRCRAASTRTSADSTPRRTSRP